MAALKLLTFLFIPVSIKLIYNRIFIFATLVQNSSNRNTACYINENEEILLPDEKLFILKDADCKQGNIEETCLPEMISPRFESVFSKSPLIYKN